jgi:rubrerythrin
MIDSEISRRQLLVRSAVAAAGLSLSMSILAARKAHAEVNPPEDKTADNVLLKALLAAEYDAINTYTAGAGILAQPSAGPEATRGIVTKVAVHFQDQHKDHAAALKALIIANGGSVSDVDETKAPAIPAAFASSPKTFLEVIKLAADKEKAAAFTYAKTMETISTRAAAKLIAAIGGVETQHFVVLYLLANGVISANTKTGTDAALVVPASFVVDVGMAKDLKNFPALDALLALVPKAT